MWPATAWDDSDWHGGRARAWTVMGALRAQQERHRNEARSARRLLRRLGIPEDVVCDMLPALGDPVYEARIKANWKGGPTVLAFLFAQPDSAAIQMLDARGRYFDVRTGETWDLFFPGYYHSKDSKLERRTGGVPVGTKFASDWYFREEDFDKLREHIERKSQGRWRYSGGADLVLINGMLVDNGEPTIDWVSTQGWDMTDTTSNGQTLALSKVVESITRDLETNAEDPSYGLREPADGTSTSGRGSASRSFVLDTVREIAVALGLKLAGL